MSILSEGLLYITLKRAFVKMMALLYPRFQGNTCLPLMLSKSVGPFSIVFTLTIHRPRLEAHRFARKHVVAEVPFFNIPFQNVSWLAQGDWPR